MAIQRIRAKTRRMLHHWAPIAWLTAGSEGVVFIPFHYGYWDITSDAGPGGRPRAANELTMTIWDPVSKQPQLKIAAVKLERVG